MAVVQLYWSVLSVTLMLSLSGEGHASAELRDLDDTNADLHRQRRQVTTPLPVSQLTVNNTNDILEFHLAMREDAGQNAGNMLLMEYGADLASLAQATAETCQFRKANLNFPDNGTDVGQIIFHSSATAQPIPLLQTLFDDGQGNYTYDTNECDATGACDDYKQIIWATTRYVGCGKQFCGVLFLPDGSLSFAEWFWVCNYMEVGGLADEHPYLASDEPCSFCNIEPGTICERNQCRACDPTMDAQCRQSNDTQCVSDIDSCCSNYAFDTYCQPGTDYYPYMVENCGAWCDIYVCGSI